MLSQSHNPRWWLHAGAMAGGLIIAAGGCSYRACQPVPCAPAFYSAPLPCFGFHGTYWRAWPEECVTYPSYEMPEQAEVLPIEKISEPESQPELPAEPPIAEP